MTPSDSPIAENALAPVGAERLKRSLPTAIQVKSLLGYVCACLILIEGVGLVWNLERQRSAQAESDQSRTLRRTMMQAQLALVDMETGQRGYLLTGDETYLQPYNTGMQQLRESFDALASLTEGNALQHASVSQIAALASAKSTELRSTIDAHRAGVDSLGLVRTHHGKRLMDEIRERSAEFLRLECEAFDRSASRFKRLSDLVLAISCAGTALAFLLASAATLWTRQAVAETYAAKVESEARAAELRVKAETLAQQETVQAQQLREQQKLSLELTQVNVALALSNSDLEQFSYVASHDLKAPLRGIANLSSWIEDDLGSAVTEEARKQFALLRGRVQRLEALINGIAEYSRAGRESGQVERVDVETMLKEVCDLAAPNAQVKIVVATAMPKLWTSPTPLQQIFSNLISNAMKHATPHQGCITIRSDNDSGLWRFSVSDNGPGIDPAFHKRIFELFQTLDSKDRVEGSGIGLALVKKLVERYGGSVMVKSALGEGATFSFTWPEVSPMQTGMQPS